MITCFYCKQVFLGEFFVVKQALYPKEVPFRWERLGYCCLSCEKEGNPVSIDIFDKQDK